MKFSFLTPFKKRAHEKQLNPFHHDTTSMGQRIGDGRLVVMYTGYDNYKSVVLVDTCTGERINIEFTQPKKIVWKDIKGD